MSILQCGQSLDPGSQGSGQPGIRPPPLEVVFPGWENAWHCLVKARDVLEQKLFPRIKASRCSSAVTCVKSITILQSVQNSAVAINVLMLAAFKTDRNLNSAFR